MSQPTSPRATSPPWSAPDSLGFAVWNRLSKPEVSVPRVMSISNSASAIHDRHLSFIGTLSVAAPGSAEPADGMRADDLRVFRRAALTLRGPSRVWHGVIHRSRPPAVAAEPAQALPARFDGEAERVPAQSSGGNVLSAQARGDAVVARGRLMAVQSRQPAATPDAEVPVTDGMDAVAWDSNANPQPQPERSSPAAGRPDGGNETNGRSAGSSPPQALPASAVGPSPTPSADRDSRAMAPGSATGPLAVAGGLAEQNGDATHAVPASVLAHASGAGMEPLTSSPSHRGGEPLSSATMPNGARRDIVRAASGASSAAGAMVWRATRVPGGAMPSPQQAHPESVALMQSPNAASLSRREMIAPRAAMARQVALVASDPALAATGVMMRQATRVSDAAMLPLQRAGPESIALPRSVSGASHRPAIAPRPEMAQQAALAASDPSWRGGASLSAARLVSRDLPQFSPRMSLRAAASGGRFDVPLVVVPHGASSGAGGERDASSSAVADVASSTIAATGQRVLMADRTVATTEQPISNPSVAPIGSAAFAGAAAGDSLRLSAPDTLVPHPEIAPLESSGRSMMPGETLHHHATQVIVLRSQAAEPAIAILRSQGEIRHSSRIADEPGRVNDASTAAFRPGSGAASLRPPQDVAQSMTSRTAGFGIVVASAHPPGTATESGGVAQAGKSIGRSVRRGELPSLLPGAIQPVMPLAANGRSVRIGRSSRVAGDQSSSIVLLDVMAPPAPFSPPASTGLVVHPSQPLTPERPITILPSITAMRSVAINRNTRLLGLPFIEDQERLVAASHRPAPAGQRNGAMHAARHIINLDRAKNRDDSAQVPGMFVGASIAGGTADARNDHTASRGQRSPSIAADPVSSATTTAYGMTAMPMRLTIAGNNRWPEVQASPVARPRALRADAGAPWTAVQPRIDPVSALGPDNRHKERVADDLPLALVSRPIGRNRSREIATDVWHEVAPAPVPGIVVPVSAGISVDRAASHTQAAASLPGAVTTETATTAGTAPQGAQNQQAPDVDDIVERTLRALMSRLTIEQERRGFSQWS